MTARAPISFRGALGIGVANIAAGMWMALGSRSKRYGFTAELEKAQELSAAIDAELYGLDTVRLIAS